MNKKKIKKNNKKNKDVCDLFSLEARERAIKQVFENEEFPESSQALKDLIKELSKQ
ncbi:hypothetical protein [Mycoplasmoides alvi]|uniref:hypothetical protein n=1 Tax=Mycoplasmoides alvi TaxID=78580 RepID=UPI000AD5495F|nr:hypothetical protein [Mycoplasmoides alvi]